MIEAGNVSHAKKNTVVAVKSTEQLPSSLKQNSQKVKKEQKVGFHKATHKTIEIGALGQSTMKLELNQEEKEFEKWIDQASEIPSVQEAQNSKSESYFEKKESLTPVHLAEKKVSAFSGKLEQQISPKVSKELDNQSVVSQPFSAKGRIKIKVDFSTTRSAGK